MNSESDSNKDQPSKGGHDKPTDAAWDFSADEAEQLASNFRPSWEPDTAGKAVEKTPSPDVEAKPAGEPKQAPADADKVAPADIKTDLKRDSYAPRPGMNKQSASGDKNDEPAKNEQDAKLKPSPSVVINQDSAVDRVKSSPGAPRPGQTLKIEATAKEPTPKPQVAAGDNKAISDDSKVTAAKPAEKEPEKPPVELAQEPKRDEAQEDQVIVDEEPVEERRQAGNSYNVSVPDISDDQMPEAIDEPVIERQRSAPVARANYDESTDPSIRAPRAKSSKGIVIAVLAIAALVGIAAAVKLLVLKDSSAEQVTPIATSPVVPAEPVAPQPTQTTKPTAEPAPVVTAPASVAPVVTAAPAATTPPAPVAQTPPAPAQPAQAAAVTPKPQTTKASDKPTPAPATPPVAAKPAPAKPAPAGKPGGKPGIVRDAPF